jgi:hypothetical protein
MGDFRGADIASGFGQVDLDLDDEPNVAPRPAAPPPASSGRAFGAFGELDFDLGDSPDANEPPPPPSTSRVFGPATSKRPSDRTVARSVSSHDIDTSAQDQGRPFSVGSVGSVGSVHDESTRIFSPEARDALAVLSRPPPPSPLNEDGNTRAWDEIDEALLSVGEDDASPSSRSGALPAPSGSGVAARDGRVAAMRDLYARGDAAGALALGAILGQSLAPSAGDDHPDASVVVDFGEQSIDLLDPFGGLIPLDDDLASTSTVVPPAYTAASTTTAPPAPAHPAGAMPCPAALLTLTERQSIPRVLKSMAEVSKLKIDHRAGFLLAHVDGMQTLEEILDICAMPSAEALALISRLKEMGVIEFE